MLKFCQRFFFIIFISFLLFLIILSEYYLKVHAPYESVGVNITNDWFSSKENPSNNSAFAEGYLTSNDSLSSNNKSSSHSEDRVCSSIDVRNKVSNLLLLRGCRVVEGSVQIVLIDHANETDYDQLSFPELREITQYLLLYRVSGLRSLGQLFPSLTTIRGARVFQDYALVLFEMFHLQEVGLRSLAEITRGAVRIEKNPSLCFVNTLNWDLIAKWSSVKNYILYNKSPADCPDHSVCQEAGCPLSLCWSREDCQIQAKEIYKDCDAECLGGCTGPGPKACHSCRNYLTHDGECVSDCPHQTYMHLNKRCVTREQCLSLIDYQKDSSKEFDFIVFNGSCVQGCPPGYDYSDKKLTCEKCRGGKCRKVCPGLHIDNISAAQTLKNCTFIDGSLEISIRYGKHKLIFEELEDSLKSIEEIKGYLKVIRNFPLFSLKFFKNLRHIHGDQDLLENGKYSLTVLENQNLQELWDLPDNFTISNGKIFFHYNPKLCFHHIQKLITVSGLNNVSSYEVAPESNGDKFTCNFTDIDISFPIIKHNSVSVVITVQNTSITSLNLQRFVLYYTESNNKNVTIFEETDQCGDDHWKIRDVLEPPDHEGKITIIQTFLQDFTQYAFYVKTYTSDGIFGPSQIHYVKTMPSQPSQVVLLSYFSNDSSTIVLQWEPPERVNGVLAGYRISGFLQEDEREFFDQRNYCEHPMTYTDNEDLPPDLLTHVESEKKNCCPENKIIYKPNHGYKRICDNLKQGELSFDSEDADLSVVCSKYFYEYINNNPLLEEDDATKNCNTTNPPNKRSFTKRGIANKIKRRSQFFHIARSDTQIYTVTNLQHFSKYTISIEACRERQGTQNDTEPRCSKPQTVTVRTLKDADKDKIDNNYVNYEVIEEEDSEILQIAWEEPKNPNGLVVAFEIELLRRDLENSSATIECLVYSDYAKNDKTHTIRNLLPGNYQFRIRPLSLAGPGEFTEIHTFTLDTISKARYYIFVVLFVLALLIGGGGGGYYMFYHRQKYLSDMDSLLTEENNETLTNSSYLEESWEIQQDNVELSRELYQGSFTTVYEGILYPSKVQCIVKTSNVTDKDGWFNEITILKHASGVHHIVQILGIVSDCRPAWVVMEFMAHGDLKSYLKNTKELPPLGSRFLLMAAQIADAMFFLETNKIVHRDLAARNCMVHKDLTVKLGDVGLAREVYPKDYYRKSEKVSLPVRWMSPESLKDGLFTSRSDVWSYGVLLWEIATLGEQPYQGYTNDQVLRRVVDGETLPMPVFCPEPIKTAINQCWQRNPNLRPHFCQLVAHLEPHTDETFRRVSYYHTSEATEDNRGETSYNRPTAKLFF